jgi:hypothetical protein
VTDAEIHQRQANHSKIAKDANAYPNFKDVNDDIIESLRSLMLDTETPQKNLNDGGLNEK